MESLLYEQLADRLIDHIEEGVYPVGSRLPSVRALAKSEQVSIATVTSAYSILEERGWAEPRPKSGYFVKRTAIEPLSMPKKSRAKTSPRAVTVAELAMAIQRGAAASRGVVFSAAIPDLEFPIAEVVKRNFTRLSRYSSSFGNGYETPEGLLELRLQIARRAIDAGVHISPDALITTMGAQNAISHALRALTTAGDIVAVESPCYFGLLQMIEGFGLKAIEIPTDPVTGISVDALTLALQRWPIKAILTIPAFTNPLGCIIPMEKKRILIQLAQRYDIPIIEDDIYGDLQFEGRRSKALKSIDPDGRVLWCSSVSKTMDPHLRVGWIAPGRYYDEVLQQKFVSEISSPTLPQVVTAEIMKKGLYDRHLRHARASYHQRYMRLLELAREHFPESMRVSSAKGGLVAWFEMPRSVDATELYYICREEDIHIAPGELFSVSGLYQNCFRLSFSNEWTPEREQAIAFIGRILKKMT
ncbi:PLP-dependent aminotransferase family protein [Reinekea marinisedimentorum]|uniref:DNA-binding transcriptional MocR family regulator n=1 Tax=Reinekea marinisedimentorum TaxID=230495 RepID=A0A4R3HRZ6_9GAMM|nr:PLP-dependent aminotransferase family protein [Reinekea marinisedimentorum]TCS35907.1 DNA-binding transcriptional MocR family regulator [Reinekea marinisedimentorum]